MKTLKEWRSERRLTQAGLGELAGVTHLTVLNIEHGHKVPRTATMRCLAAALGVKPREIAEFDTAIRQKGESLAA